MTTTSATPPFRYRAFISYSHQDESWAGWLHKALEAYVIPKRLAGQATATGFTSKRLAPVFRDRDELSSATDLRHEVDEALAGSECLIVICSPHAATSRWVDQEILTFKRLGRSERIFCLIVEGEPGASELPGREAEECFARSLRRQIAANGTLGDQRTEPIAADVRPGKDSKLNAKLKLIAGMLEVGFDALKQREQQRRLRRLTAIAASAVVVMLVTTALAINAVIAQQAAERRQKQAEDLVGFMLGDLNDKLAQVARLDIMQSVDDKAMAYFQSLPVNDVTDTALAQRAKALEKIGSVRLDQGHLPAALEAFRASARISAELTKIAPADVAGQIAYARTLSFTGMTYWAQGKLDLAQQNFESSRNILLLAQMRSSNDRPLKFELQNVSNNIGHVAEARGQPDAAVAAYRDMLALSQDLATVDPGNRRWVSALGDAHNNLGKMALLHGDLALAVAEYRADDAIETDLSARDPRDNDQQENMLRARAILGRTLGLAGDADTGMRYLQQAVDIATRLVQVDPAQTSFQNNLAIYLSQLSRLKRLDADLPAARAQTARSSRIISALIKQDPANTDWQRHDAEVRIEQAAESKAGGQTDAARAQAQAALSILGPLFARQPNDRGLLLDTVAAKLLLADVAGNAPAAQQLRDEAAKTTQSVKSSGNDPRLLALQVEALLGLQRGTEAKAALQRLWNSGYRDPALLAVLQRQHVDYPINIATSQLIARGAQPHAADAPGPQDFAHSTNGER